MTRHLFGSDSYEATFAVYILPNVYFRNVSYGSNLNFRQQLKGKASVQGPSAGTASVHNGEETASLESWS